MVERAYWVWIGAGICALAGCRGELTDVPERPALPDVCSAPDEQCAQVDFAREIQPILSESCVRCHGGVREMGNLNLQTRAAASRVLGTGDGDAEGSALYLRVASADHGPRMPLGVPALATEQVAKIRRWVEVGAPWPTHWSFQPVARVAPADMPVSDPSWSRSPVDRFVLSRLERAGIPPAADAPPATLVRRLALDLTGLPPTPEEVDAFSADPSERALEALIDRLLASPAFGERWGRHWLDQARYSDSDGYEKDTPRMNAWRYRDWVVAAFNDDMPFDQFTLQQIAGDLLPDATPLTRLATAFHRQTLLNTEGGIDPEEDRVKRVVDRTATVANTWLGLTLQCAQCHGHPYDQISHEDFYRLYAFFDRAGEGTTQVPKSGPSDYVRMDADVLQERTGPVVTLLLLRGNFLTPDTKKGALAPRAPEAIFRFIPTSGSPNRLDLARWLVHPEHPLTSRVLVNTIWSHLFGRGIVATLDDFGSRGELPSHPELLDFLARDLVANGFRQKRAIKQIVMSRTYRQASSARPEYVDRDPSNALLSRQGRFRLEAEALRDSALLASGLLSRKSGGSSVFPPLSEEVRPLVRGPYSDFEWVDSTGEDRYRRSLYTFHKRSAPYPNLSLFDWPTATASVNARSRSSTPLQALATLHDVTFLDVARALARRALRERPEGVVAQVTRVFRLALGRAPSEAELDELVALHAQGHASHLSDPNTAVALLSDAPPPPEELASLAALVSVARVVTNLEEFMTRE